ncbi:unnamed protein product [Diamesa serratosioi]
MGKRKHGKFIDKKKAVTFRLVNRSQHDPLIVDENAPQHVLVPINEERESGSSTNPKVKRKKDEQKFGVFFDDDYDYLQHLREAARQEVHWEEVVNTKKDEGKEKEKENKPKLQLPSSVFPSEFEEKEGMLRKAIKIQGPRPDWDPDIVETLDDEFDHENPDNELEDNFMEMAMGGDGDESEEEWEDDEDDDDDEERSIGSNDADYSDNEENDDLGPLMPRDNFDKDETKSRFTEYSMTSSVLRRNEQLTLLDDRFEKFFENYDEVGPLDCEEIEGHVDINDELLLQYAKDFDKDEKHQRYDKAWDVCRITKENHDSDEEETMLDLEVTDTENNKKRWDCESILSTYSNIYNHPKLIEIPSKKRPSKIQINPKTGIPMNTLDGENSGKLTMKSLAKLNTAQHEQEVNKFGARSVCAESVFSTLSVLSIRPKDESAEEKRDRKKLLKEYRGERRIEKKANQTAFKEEKMRQNSIKINAQNTQGNRIL